MREMRHKVGVCACLAIGGVIWFLPPPLSADDVILTRTSMHFAGVFAAVIGSLIVTDCQISIVGAVAMAFLALTQNLKCWTVSGKLEQVECQLCHQDEYACNPSSDAFRAALAGFSNDINWLVFAAFHIGRAVEKTRLGHRISLILIRYLGRSMLGIGYAVYISELLLAPFVPSNTARGGGILMPIVLSICVTLKSTAVINARRYGGEYLMLCGAHANLLSASLFQTAMAANPLISSAAKSILGVEFSYMTWFAGAIVPTLFLLSVSPYIIYRYSLISAMSTPSSTQIVDGFDNDEDECRNESRVLIDEAEPCHQMTDNSLEDVSQLLAATRLRVATDLAAMGRIRLQEAKLILTLCTAFSLWLTTEWTGLDVSLIAFCAVAVMVLTDVITWEDVLSNRKAWDTFFWLGILIMMAQQLTYLNISTFIGTKIATIVGAAQIGPISSALVLSLVYFYSMYLFSSLSGHILAFMGPFLHAAQSLHCPLLLMVGLMAYFSTLCGCLTNFSSGPVVIYFSQGYCSRVRWFKIGFVFSILYISVFFTIGIGWWKLLGWW